jgi:tetratricopeptide (TPR) repeat protein
VTAPRGLLGLAREDLHRRARTAATTNCLHGLAVVSTALAHVRLAEGATEDGVLFLGEALGAWAGLLHRDEPLVRFALGRFSRYAHNGPMPDARRLREMVSGMVGAVVEQAAPRCGLEPARLALMWDLEKEAVGQVAQAGGLRLSDDRTLPAGPLLAHSLGLHDSVRALRNSSGGGEESLSALKRMLREMLNLNFDFLPEPARAPADLPRLFSPLGPASRLLRNRQFGAALQEVDAITAGNGGRENDWFGRLLHEFSAHEGEAWLERQAQELALECHLQSSRDLVGCVPIDLAEVRQAWQRALAQAALLGNEDDANKTIAEIANGRALALFARRNRQQRLADEHDRRGSKVRRQEAFDLMELAWEMTRHPDVQASLANHLNLHAVSVFDSTRDFDATLDLLVRSIEIRPSSRQVLDNYGAVVMQRLGKQFTEQGPDVAGQGLEANIQRLRNLDLGGSSEEVQRCLQELADRGTTPFFNASGAAFGAGDLPTATDQLIWCLRLGPEVNEVRHAAHVLAQRLRAQSGQGDPVARECHLRLAPYLRSGEGVEVGLPGEGLELLRLLARLAQAQQMGPGPGATPLELNRRAVAEANAERFAQSMELLEQALRLDPSSSQTRINLKNVGDAWAARAVMAGDFDTFLHIQMKLRELLGNE